VQGLRICTAPFFRHTLAIVIAITFPVLLHAQLCSGSLGDPAVNITFGNGGPDSSGNRPTNAYTYTNSTCPNDGYYTITNSTSGCFNNSWHTVSSDHTGGGSFMLVNASYDPGDFFVSTVTDLCPNTTYEFAAWIINVLNRFGIKPNLTFSIETPSGEILQQYFTGDILESTRPTWKQYGFYFITPVNNPVIVLRIRNNAPGGNGNDLGLDDITFRPCGASITSDIVNSPDTVDVCEGNRNAYTFVSEVSSSYASPVYQWQESTDSGKTWVDIAGADSLTYFYEPKIPPGRYAYRMAVTERTSSGIKACRIASNVVVINVHANPAVDAGPDRVVIKDDSTVLGGSVTGEEPTFLWTPPSYLSDNTIQKPVSKPPSTIEYTLSAQSSFGCPAQDKVNVKVVAGIFVPNAFTPNGDGLNDHWRIPYLDPELGATVSLYNRYGQLVYHVDGKIVDWDGNIGGKPQQTGIYVYYITFKTGRKPMRGFVNLIR
jgi:gliding motility-associated-like protein